MTATDAARQPAIGWPIVRHVGRAIAYLSVPATLVVWPTLESPVSVLIGVYLLAAIGFAAVVRGAKVPAIMIQAGYFALASYCVLLAIELLNGDLLRYPRPLDADFLLTYFVLLALPFLAIGIREVGVNLATLEKVAIATVLLAVGWSLYQRYGLRIARPGGFGSFNPIPFAFVVAMWGTFVFSRALQSQRIDAIKAAVALAGLIPIVLSGSKLVWICAVCGYGLLFVWWALTWRRWFAIAAALAISAASGYGLYQVGFIRGRIRPLIRELSAYLETGDTSGLTFGLRVAAATAGWLAFVDQPLKGYGLANVKLAALLHRPDTIADFSGLWHLHNQYVVHLVAFGILGLLFLVALLAALMNAAWRTGDTSLWRFGVAVALMAAIYMGADLIFPRTPLYGSFFLLFGFMLVAAANREQGDEPVASA